MYHLSNILNIRIFSLWRLYSVQNICILSFWSSYINNEWPIAMNVWVLFSNQYISINNLYYLNNNEYHLLLLLFGIHPLPVFFSVLLFYSSRISQFFSDLFWRQHMSYVYLYVFLLPHSIFFTHSKLLNFHLPIDKSYDFQQYCSDWMEYINKKLSLWAKQAYVTD